MFVYMRQALSTTSTASTMSTAAKRQRPQRGRQNTAQGKHAGGGRNPG